MNQKTRIPCLLSLIGILSLMGCGQGGSQLTNTTLTGGGSLQTFGALNVRAAVTNPIVASTGNGASAFGLTGQISTLELNNQTGDFAASRILFSSNRGGNKLIYSMRADGSDVTRLTSNIEDDTDPMWSPDGTKIAYASTRNSSQEIYVMNADGSGQTRLTNNGNNEFHPTWSPDGAKIAFVRQLDETTVICVMNANGTNQIQITSNTTSDSFPAWSPDGTKIAFVSGRDGNPELYTMNPDGTNQTRLTNTFGQEWAPSWSPDGTQLAFYTDRDGGNYEIYVCNADGTGSRRLTNNTASDTFPHWSPDGKRIVFVSGRDGNDEVYTMNLSGSNQINLSNNSGTDEAPSWYPFQNKIALVGTKGKLGTTATGFLYGSANQKPASAVSWSNADFSQLQLKALSGANVTGDMLLFSIEGATNAVNFTSLRFWNFNQPLTVNALTISNLNGALISFGSTDGQVKSVLPFTAPNRSTGRPTVKTENGQTVFRGNFPSVWDKSGKNLAPHGATAVIMDSKTGNVLRVEQ